MNRTPKEIIEARNRKGPSLMTQLTRYLNNWYRWVRYRTFDRYNVIKITSLKPGYYDKDTQLLFGAFDLLVKFCEVELAWLEMYKVKVPWWQTREQYRKAHAEELVLQYFKWAEEYRDESSPTQGHPKSEYHKELRELYHWWKHTRPARLDSVKYWANNGRNKEAFKRSVEMDDAYEAEDTANFVRLVKARGAMWT